MVRMDNRVDSNGKPEAVWECALCGRQKTQTLRTPRKPKHPGGFKPNKETPS